MSHRPILIMAGGTGGHVYPALAIADYLRQQEVPVFWLGTKTGLEAKVVVDKGYRLFTINISGLRGKSIYRWLLAPWMLLLAFIQSILVIIRVKPAAVLGMGGFVTGPGGVATWILRIPLYIHEQNSIAGLTNKLLSHLAKVIMQGFPMTFRPGQRIRTTGNPVREELIALPTPEQRLLEHEQRHMRLLILGGSLGARAINENVPAALQHLVPDININIWHQTGERHLNDTKKFYKAVKGTNQPRIVAYIDNMAEAYKWADLVLCRAGALTIAELCAVGVASILIPYPFAVDDHQTSNARYLTDKSCAILLPEFKLEEKSLAALLQDFYKARNRLLEMAKKTRKLACPDATQLVGNICLEAASA